MRKLMSVLVLIFMFFGLYTFADLIDVNECIKSMSIGDNIKPPSNGDGLPTGPSVSL